MKISSLKGSSLAALSLPLCLVFLMCGCHHGGAEQGISGQNYVSRVRPAISIRAASLPLHSFARGTGTLYRPQMTGIPVKVQTAVYASGSDGPVAIAAHARLPEHKRWIWSTVYPRTGAIHEAEVTMGGMNMTAFTYLVPCRTDPFAGVVGEAVEGGAGKDGEAQPGFWVARHFAAPMNFRQDKISLEYREKAPAELTALSPIPYGMTDWLKGFEERAAKAFSVAAPENAADLQQCSMGSVRWHYMSDAWLGDAMENFERDWRF